MPAKNKNKKENKKAEAPRRNPGATPARPGLFKRLKSALPPAEKLRGDTPRFAAGLLMLALSVFLILCLVSNIFTGQYDQSAVESSAPMENAVNWGGNFGACLSAYLMNDCFGLCALFIPLLLVMLAMKLVNAYKVRMWKWFLNFSILMIWGSVFLSLLEDALPKGAISYFPFPLGGGHGIFVENALKENLGLPGAWIAVIAAAVLYLLYLTRETKNFVRRMLNPMDYRRHRAEKAAEGADAEDFATETDETDAIHGTDAKESGSEDAERGDEYTSPDADEAENDADGLENNTYATSSGNGEGCPNGADSSTLSLDLTAAPAPAPEPAAASTLTPMEAGAEATSSEMEITAGQDNEAASGKTVEEVAAMEPYDPRKDLEFYKFPTLDLLKKYTDDTPEIDMAEQNANKDRIITVLSNFGVEISSIKATIGPTITLYEVTPAPGVRINKIRNLEDDIALSLSALGIRIIAPIPGKGTIGIEVPNKKPRIVSMESIINTRKFEESGFELPMALGKTITNEVFMVDLAKMPHLLVAGATGQGKSVGLNAIITSLLYKKHPAELKFVLVDPKKVELSVYAPLEYHFLAKIPAEDDEPVITDVTKVVQTLNSLCQLMDHRYDLLKKARVRNIKEYNAKFKARQLNPENGHEFMPYIVVVIDEFGDLIMTAGKEVELPIARIAQLARAVGMHMIIATQRPTTNIITGTIKTNFPARMAFKVSSQMDSRVILDRTGADQLVGRGDMLFLAGNTPVRVQCAFVDTPEVEHINEYIASQQGYISAFELPEPETDGEGGSSAGVDPDQLDPLFDEAAKLIVIHQQGSTSLIQRKFSIGYNRAGRLMDQLEHAGIVGPVRGSKPREVLIQDVAELEMKLSAMR